MWRKVAMKGTVPAPRHGHTLTAFAENKAALFGGVCDAGGSAATLNDLHVIDTGAWLPTPSLSRLCLAVHGAMGRNVLGIDEQAAVCSGVVVVVPRE